MRPVDLFEHVFDDLSMAPPPTETVAQLQQLLQHHGAAASSWSVGAAQDTPDRSTPAASSTAGLTGVPVHPVFAEAFPRGLRAGAVYSLQGSMTTALALLAGPSLTGAWCGVVGVPDLGIEAAAEWGVALDRLALVPRFRPADWLTVVTALSEVTALVLATPPEQIAPGEISRLLARLRSSGSTLVVLGPWTRAAATITGRVAEWEGLHDGHGCLQAGRMRVEVAERHVRRQIEFAVPVRP